MIFYRFSDLEDIIKKKNLKVMVLSYPSNPTGAILSKEEVISYII